MRLEEGDITRVEADAIVNAANARLAGGGGVDGAIHRAAGPGVMAELNAIRAKIGHCPAGQAVATKAGKLRALYIFHAVGPVYRGGGEGEAEQLASCYRECLRMAAERDLESRRCGLLSVVSRHRVRVSSVRLLTRAFRTGC